MASQVEGIKRVPGTPFIVDGFRFQGPHCRHYFLTHAHSDHTTGLTRGFRAGTIYCTPVTAAVLQLDIGLPPGVVHPLALDETVSIAGVEVTPLDANHCPGACMFLFRAPPTAAQQAQGAEGAGAAGTDAQVVLHTGDLRWHPRMAAHPAIARAGRISCLMLDTTYCAPKWDLPSQEEAVGMIVDLLRSEAEVHPATLFVMGSYHIGKERAYLGAAYQLGWRVYCPPAKRKVLRVLGLPREWVGLLEDNPSLARLHVLGMGEQLHEQALAERLRGTQWTRVVAIRPTGWSFKKGGGLSRREAGCVVTVGVPYSEHSSFGELKDCVRMLRPMRIVPTVNAADPVKARALVDMLADCTSLSSDKSRLDCYLARPSAVQRSTPSTGAGAAGAAAIKPGHVAAEPPLELLWARQAGGCAGALAARQGDAPWRSAAWRAALPKAGAEPPQPPAEATGTPAGSGTGECRANASSAAGQAQGAGEQRLGMNGVGLGGAAPGPQVAAEPRGLQRSASSLERESWDIVVDLGSEDFTGCSEESSVLSGAGTAARGESPAAPGCLAEAQPGPQPGSGGGKLESGSNGQAAAGEKPGRGSVTPGGQTCSGSRASRGSAGASVGGDEGSEVDLALIDIAEQERILAGIAAARASGGRRASGSGSASGSSASKLRQGSMLRFLGVRQPQQRK